MLRIALGLLVLAAPLALRADVPPRSPPKLVAVLEFQSPLPEAQRAQFGERLLFASLVRTKLALGLGPRGKVITLDEMHRLATANPDALDKCDDSCIGVGKLLGADFVVEGVLGLEGKKLQATLRLYDVRKAGPPLAQAVVTAATADKLLVETQAAAGKLADKVPLPEK